MPNPYVNSKYERKLNDHYPTIDPRCTYAFLEIFTPVGVCVDMCAPNGSGIVDSLRECGKNAVCAGNAFQSVLNADWGVTNPPYDRPLVDDIITAQIERIEKSQMNNLAVLLRNNWDFSKIPQRVKNLEHPTYAGQIKMRFRPWWTEDRSKQPIHNFIWHIWRDSARDQDPRIWYAYGDKDRIATKQLAQKLLKQGDKND